LTDIPRQEGGRAVFVSIRTYRVGKGSIDELMHRVDRDMAEAFAQEPGFISYQVARTGDRTVASVTTFREREQAEASNDLAAQWVAEELADFEAERMGVMGGEVMVSRANAEMLEPAHH
jgi:heme-degrading monooxygenase HmoA